MQVMKLNLSRLSIIEIESGVTVFPAVFLNNTRLAFQYTFTVGALLVVVEKEREVINSGRGKWLFELIDFPMVQIIISGASGGKLLCVRFGLLKMKSLLTLPCCPFG